MDYCVRIMVKEGYSKHRIIHSEAQSYTSIGYVWNYRFGFLEVMQEGMDCPRSYI